MRKGLCVKTPPNSLKNLAFNHLTLLFKKYDTDNKALDFVYGVGYSTSFLKSLGFNCSGIDINPKMVELAQENDKKGACQSIINSKIPYGNEIFDLVLASFALLEMSSLEQIEEALIEIIRVLKPEGHFVAILGNKNTYKYNWSALNTNFPQNKILRSGKSKN